MTTEKCSEVLDRYERKLDELLLDREHARKKGWLWLDNMNHLATMPPRMRGFLSEGRTDKFMRWLGFMQGAFWVMGTYSIEDMKNHNRPDEERDCIPNWPADYDLPG